MPVILGPDGPSLGGFVCPVTVIEADLWQLGQLKAGDRVQFIAVDLPTARRLADARDQESATLTPDQQDWQATAPASPIVLDTGAGDQRLVARLSGDTHLLLEVGAPELDLVTRFRAHALMQALQAQDIDGIVDLTPGIRSLQVHYCPRKLPLPVLLQDIAAQWARVSAARDLSVPSRIVHLPLSWDDPACQLAIDKYMTTVRKDAPWCPSNLEFIRRINDLPDIDAVRQTVFDASYLVMGLGDVYLGAPVATPLDPRHRLVTTKYNPARTWTAENSVGIGGAYLCVYGMEGPGGYQFVGRTLQMWNRYRTVPAFDGQPWLLRFFDQLRFYPVSADELARIRRDFPLGRFPCGSSRRNCTWPNTRTSCAARPRTSRPSNHTRPRPSTRSASAGSTPDRRTSKATTRRQAPPGRSAAARRLPRRGKRYHRQPVAGAGTGRSASTGWPGTRRPGIDENGNHRECATGRRRARSARATRRLGARGPVRRGHRSQSRRFDSVNITALNKTRDLGTVQAYDGTHPGHSRSSFVMPPTIPAVPRGLPRRLEMPWNANGLSGVDLHAYSGRHGTHPAGSARCPAASSVTPE